MHHHALRHVATGALLAIAGCSAPTEDPAVQLAAETSDGGVDAALERGSPVILGDAFVAPRADARADSPAAPTEPFRWDSGSPPDASPVDSGTVRVDAWISDACSPDACADAAVWNGREECDGRTDGRTPDVADAAHEAQAGDAARDAEAGGASDASPDAPEPATDHLIITEVVSRPGGAEMIEVFNPTVSPVDLSDYALSDSNLYYTIAAGSFSTASGSDFVAFFPVGSRISPGGYRTVSIANGTGGQVSFESVYGKKPDFELRPTANGAIDDPDVPNMRPLTGISSIGATASLTDAGEPVVLFRYASGNLVYDVDYVFYGAVSAANPPVDKTAVVVDGSAYLVDRGGSALKPAAVPGDGGALHRCWYGESDEVKSGGNGTTCHDETSEDFSKAFARSANAADQRTPGGPPPPGLCP